MGALRDLTEDRRNAVRRMPCLVRGHPDRPCKVVRWGEYVSQCAHAPRVRSHGDENNIVPLCLYHHAEQHNIGIRSFERRYAVDLEREARRVWRSITEGTPFMEDE